MKLKPLGYKSQSETATLPILTALVSVATLTRRASPEESSPCASSDLKHAGEKSIRERTNVTYKTAVWARKPGGVKGAGTREIQIQKGGGREEGGRRKGRKREEGRKEEERRKGGRKLSRAEKDPPFGTTYRSIDEEQTKCCLDWEFTSGLYTVKHVGRKAWI